MTILMMFAIMRIGLMEFDVDIYICFAGDLKHHCKQELCGCHR